LTFVPIRDVISLKIEFILTPAVRIWVSTFCHVNGAWQQMGLELMAGFIGLFDTARVYTL
jgi:hypothetical protein